MKDSDFNTFVHRAIGRTQPVINNLCMLPGANWLSRILASLPPDLWQVPFGSAHEMIDVGLHRTMFTEMWIVVQQRVVFAGEIIARDSLNTLTFVPKRV